jgi:hypothetical protein
MKVSYLFTLFTFKSLYCGAVKDGIAGYFCTGFYAELLALHNSEGRVERRKKVRGKAVSAKQRNKGINTM